MDIDSYSTIITQKNNRVYEDDCRDMVILQNTM